MYRKNFPDRKEQRRLDAQTRKEIYAQRLQSVDLIPRFMPSTGVGLMYNAPLKPGERY